MPVLNQSTRKITLPSFPDSEVEVVTSLNFGTVSQLREGMDNMEAARLVLPKAIVDWNFTDADEKKLPITIDSVELLPVDDVQYLLEEIVKTVEPLKKRTSGESQATSKGKK